MQPHYYRHSIRFYGSTNPQGRYQLQISEIGEDGFPCSRAQWNFPTLKTLILFLKRYFPHSQALSQSGQPAGLGFEEVLSISGF